ncbi:unnamed protein product [Gongylonema pulchrum]|uniref:CA domain-containing protein n=1 Tax=Gongylonema pulchrum TaxID=637853 RepID=A0A183EGH8_9BILA|nr:unnamed protein product [Gongylonema pulchrum]
MKFQVPEDTPIGTVIARLSVVDADLPPNANITYSIHPNFNEQLPFAINGTTGELYVSLGLHYDNSAMYSFHVLAWDPEFRNSEDPKMKNMESPENIDLKEWEYRNCSGLLLVEVFVQSDNKIEPSFSKLEQNYVISAATLKGTIIGPAEAVDFDDDFYHKFSYHMATNSLFAMDRHSGEIYANETLNGTNQDFLLQIAITGACMPRNSNFKPSL